jgi:hypothetical protein
MSNPNLAPTIHSLAYITLSEYCRIGGFDEPVVRDTLGDSDVTWGGSGDTFVRARTLAHLCNQRAPMKVPASIDPDLFVFIG